MTLHKARALLKQKLRQGMAAAEADARAQREHLANPSKPAPLRRLKSALFEEIVHLCEKASGKKRRGLAQFAEEEIFLPKDGPHEGLRFRLDRQPFVALAWAEIMSGNYERFNALGPSQSGKTLSFFVIIILWLLFELEESVLVGIPDMGLAARKWKKDFLPVILASRYKDLLPTTGDGSRDGKKIEEVHFQNGVRMRFIGAGGGDAQRAEDTGKNLVMTEINSYDAVGAESTSKEADKITQMEARTNAFQNKKRRIFSECTVTDKKGRVSVNHENGTASRIICECPHCKAWVTPEREHLRGWKDQPTVLDARDNAYWACPACESEITHDQRTAMNRAAKLIHRGQELTPDGRIVGKMDRTDMFSIRWNAFNNLFATAASVAADEWVALRSKNKENAEKKMCQQVWAIPYEPPSLKVLPLDQAKIVKRTMGLPNGMVPRGAQALVSHLDLGQTEAWWSVYAGTPGFGMHRVQRHRIEVPSDKMDLEKALMVAMREWRERMLEGFIQEGTGELMIPDHCWVDGNWQGNKKKLGGDAYVVYQFVAESNAMDPTTTAHFTRWKAIFGRGQSQNNMDYSMPADKEGIYLGEEYHLHHATVNEGNRYAPQWIVFFNADYWKAFVHQRLSTPMPEAQDGAPLDFSGVLTLSNDTPERLAETAAHLTAESQKVKTIRGNDFLVFDKDRKANHQLDNAANCGVMLHFAGVRLLAQVAPVVAPVPTQPTAPPVRAVETEDGRPFVARRD